MHKTILALSLIACAIALLLFALPTKAAPPLQGSAHLFNFSQDSVVGFNLTDLMTRTVILSRTLEPSVWRFMKPSDSLADQNRVSETLGSLFQPVGVIADPVQMAPHIPVTSTVTMVITLTRQDNSQYGLWIGKPESSKSTYSATRGEYPEKEIFEIPITVVDQLKAFMANPPVAPTSTPSPTPTSTPTATPTATASPMPATASPTPVTPTAVPPPPTLTPLPATSIPPTETAAPTPTETPLSLTDQIAKNAGGNPELVAAGGAGCLLVLIALGVLASILLRRRGKPVEAVPPPPSAFLEGITSPGLELHLTRENMTLGRASDCDLRIPDDAPEADTVSRNHARLEKRGERWVVIDGVEEGKLSTNGVYVNGKRTLENYLTENDEISFGSVKFRFHAQPINPLPAEGGQP